MLLTLFSNEVTVANCDMTLTDSCTDNDDLDHALGKMALQAEESIISSSHEKRGSC